MDSYKKYSYSVRKNRRGKHFAFFFIVLLFFCFYQLVSKFFISSYRIQSESMLPEFSHGNMITVSHLHHASSSKRGEVVLVSFEQEQKTSFFKNFIGDFISFFTFKFYRPFEAESAYKYYVRRVAALPGDSVYMKDFILHVKPKNEKHFLTEFELTQYDYNIKTDGLVKNWSSELPFSGYMEELVLGENEYFLLCDNRIISNDSRLIGVFNDSQIKGKVLFRYFPFNKLRSF